MIKLRNYIALVYALFISLALAVLSLIINVFSERLFSEYIRENIENESMEIAETLSDQYDLSLARFNLDAVAIIGNHYLHRGFLISLVDMDGNILWYIYEADIERCHFIINNISNRMQILTGLNRYSSIFFPMR